MFRVRYFAIVFAVSILALAAGAGPVEFCTGSTVNGYTSGDSWTYGGVTLTTAPGTPECKVQSSIIPGGDVSGVGVSGKTPGEIDADETLTVNFGGNVYLESFDIAAFYNGPEYDDPREQGFVTVWFADSAQVTYWFWADPPDHSDSSLTTNLGGTITNISPMTGDNGGWFHFENPFGNRKIFQLLFTAADTPSATNNSDYALKSLVFTSGDEDVVVPEPGTFAMLGLGLLAVGLLKRRILG